MVTSLLLRRTDRDANVSTLFEHRPPGSAAVWPPSRMRYADLSRIKLRRSGCSRGPEKSPRSPPADGALSGASPSLRIATTGALPPTSGGRRFLDIAALSSNALTRQPTRARMLRTSHRRRPPSKGRSPGGACRRSAHPEEAEACPKFRQQLTSVVGLAGHA